MTPNYSAWNEALLATFFPTGLNGEPSYLAVDDETLQQVGKELGLQPDDAAPALQAAVAEQIGGDGDLLRHFLRGLDGWRSIADVPPYLALLGLFVLAASLMESRDGLHANDYYSRLNPLLGRDADSRMPPGFEQMERLWQDFSQWLDHDLGGSRGSSAIVRHEHFVHIGYPLSQCALRARDRNRLPDFFRSARLEPGDTVSDSRLLTHLKEWSLRPSANLSVNGTSAISASPGSERSKAVIAIVQRQLKLWDGQLRDADGRKRGELVLVLEIRGRRARAARLFATCPDGFPLEAEWVNPHGVGQTLISNGNGWYGEIADQKIAAVLSKGARLTSDALTLSYEPSLVVPLAKSFLPVSGWTAQTRVEPLREYNLLVNNSKVDEVAAYLKSFAISTGRQVSLEPIDLPTWSLFENVVLGSKSPPETPDGLERLVPRLNTTSRLEGGLRVGKHVYLTRGEPDLSITVAEGETYEVILDGESLVSGDEARLLFLSDFDIPCGSHTLEVAGRKFRFETITTFGDIAPPPDKQLVLSIQRGADNRPAALFASRRSDEPAPGTVEVSGAFISNFDSDLNEAASPPEVLPVGFARYAILGASPEHCMVRGPASEPGWISRIAGAALTFQFFEEDLGFTAAYVILTNSANQKSFRALTTPAVAPHGDLNHGDGTADWVREVLLAEQQGVVVAGELTSTWQQLVDRAIELQGTA